MLVRGIARQWWPSFFGIGGAVLVLAVCSSGPAGVLLMMLVGFPAAVGGLVLYFEYGWRRAVLAAGATLALVLVLGAIDKALGPGNSGGGMPPPASAR
jgi:hypothetical protein